MNSSRAGNKTNKTEKPFSMKRYKYMWQNEKVFQNWGKFKNDAVGSKPLHFLACGYINGFPYKSMHHIEMKHNNQSISQF